MRIRLRHANRLASATLLLSSLALLTACGGSDSSNNTTTPTNNSTTTDTTTVQTGVFIDAPVKGLTYKTASQSGTTNASGQFKYKNGETVTFSLDGVTLGSATAQPIVPVTLISTGTAVAQFLQTLDTDPADAVIDVSGLSLTVPSITNFKTKLATALRSNTGLENVLTATAITDIETASQKDIVNTQMVSKEAASQHVAQSVEGKAWAASDFAGKVFFDDDSGMFLLKADGTGQYYDSEDDTARMMEVTWQLNNGTMSVTFVGEDTYNLKKISETTDNMVFLPSNVASAEDNRLVTFYKAKPLTLAALNGKHFSNPDTGTDVECSARTFSFSGSNLNVREQCTGGFYDMNFSVKAVEGIANLLVAEGTVEGVSARVYMMLRSGDLNTTSQVCIANIINNQLINVNCDTFTPVSSPLQPAAR